MARRRTSKGPSQEKFFSVLQEFNRRQIRFLIAGARALAFHGYSRFTRDYDICIAPDPQIIDRVLDILNRLGFQLSEPVDASMIAQSINIHLVGDVDLDLLIHPKGFDFAEAWKRRITIQENGCEIYFVSKADLIAMKEAVSRPQDKLDVERLRRK